MKGFGFFMPIGALCAVQDRKRVGGCSGEYLAPD